jgi:hypothetical protein
MDLKHCKCPGGDAVTGARESAGKAGWNSKKAQRDVYEGTGDRGDAPGALWSSGTRWYTFSRCCSVSLPLSPKGSPPDFDVQ